MNRNELLQYIQQEYVCDVDYPWERYPDYIVIRRRDNQNGLLEFLISKAIK